MDELKEIFFNKKILVTGHTGFKGSWLCLWLELLGAKVSGYALDPKTKNDIFSISHLSERMKDLRGDIRDFKNIIEAFKEIQPEIVFHLAAQPLVIDGYNKPLYTYETNVIGTANLLEACRLSDSVKAVLVITTDKCYENKESDTGYREDDRLGGFDPYSSSKAAAEIVCSAYRNSYFNHLKIALATARAGNVIGGGDWSENRIIPDCIKTLELGKKIAVRNPGSIRPWQHVLEPLGGYLLLMSKLISNPEKYSEAWNFGPDDDSIVTVKELVEKVIAKYGAGAYQIQTNHSDKHETNTLKLNINKARSILDWKPVLSIDEATENTVAWYKMYKNRDGILEFSRKQIIDYSQKWKSRNTR